MPMPNIGHFVPPNLKRDFYHGVKGNKRTRHNGLDPYGFSTDKLLLYLPLWALRDSAFKSVDAFMTTATVTGATWQPNGRLFVANHYVSIPSTASRLNFTSGDFSIVMRIKTTDLTADNWLFDRASGVAGYFLKIANSGRIQFQTIQAGPTEQVSQSPVGDIAINNWYTVGISRVGAAVMIYKDGVDTTQTAGTHIDPATVSQNAVVGIFSNLTLFDFIGTISDVLVYSRSFPVEEQLDIHNRLAGRT